MSQRQSRLIEKIRQKDFKLNALLEITMAINSNVDTGELLGIYETTLCTNLGIEKLALFTKEDAWKCILKFGIEGDVGDITDEDFFNSSANISVSLTSAGQTESFDIVIPVYHDNAPLAYLLVGDIGENEIKMSPVIKHMHFIQTLTNVMIVAIENKKLAEDNLRQERMKKELELAAEMQAILVSQNLPKNDQFEVAAVYKPHQQVGGDYYDFLELNENEVVFCMADVSGKGVSAAFLMSNFQAYLRAIFKYRDISLKKVIIELNTQVMFSAKGEKYITLFIGKYNKYTRHLEYINCGHNPPVLAFADGRSELLSLGSIGLGMFEEIPNINVGSAELEPDAAVVCYTDGLVELEDDKLNEYGMDRLIKIIFDNFHLSVSELNDVIIRDLDDYKGDMPYVDDTALLTCRFF